MNSSGRTDFDCFLAELSGALSDDSVIITGMDILRSYARDQSRFTECALPRAVLLPRWSGQVFECLGVAHRFAIPVLPRGAGSDISGGANATEGSVVLCLKRMNKIGRIDRADRAAVVQPGVVTVDHRREAAEQGMVYPHDPGSVALSSIGRNIATNAGGMCCMKYGVTGDFVLGLEVVLADGRILPTGSQTVKGVAGYGLTRFFIGSDGTLGVVTEATLRLTSAAGPTHALVASFSDHADAGRAVSAIVESGTTLSKLGPLDKTSVQAVDRCVRMGLGDLVEAMLLAQCDDSDAVNVLALIGATCKTESAGAPIFDRCSTSSVAGG